MSARKDHSELIGRRFGKLVVTGVCRIKRKSADINGLVCQCDCGNTANVGVYTLLYGNTSSCGCSYRLQLIDKKFGKLTATERVETGNSKNKFLCVCECGGTRIAVASELNRGAIVSCGCYSRSETRRVKYLQPQLYEVWKGMKARCNNKNSTSFKNYGGKGVRVCEEWLHNFRSFFEWAMKNGFKSGLELDKDIIAKEIGVNADLYSPDRCQFVTPMTNCRNKSNNKLSIEIANEIRVSNLKRVELARKYNVNPSTIDSVKKHKIWA